MAHGLYDSKAMGAHEWVSPIDEQVLSKGITRIDNIFGQLINLRFFNDGMINKPSIGELGSWAHSSCISIKLCIGLTN